MKFVFCDRRIFAALGACCLLALPAPLCAKPPSKESLEKTAVIEVITPLRQASPPGRFSLTEWLSDNGSGGFREGYSDEHRVLDRWETVPPDLR
jgi:hypothetical protein